MNATTITSRATTALVAAVAGYASYTHIVDVAQEAGERHSVAVVLPFAVDGLILVGTLAILEDRRNGRLPRTSARVAVAFGVVATLAANIASAEPTATARLVAAVAPLAFLIAIEVLSRRGRLAEVEVTTAAVQDIGQGRAAEPLGDPLTLSVPVAEPAPSIVAAPPEPVTEPVTEPVARPVTRRITPRSLTAAERVADAHRKEPGATHERLAQLAKVSVSTVKRHRVSGPPSLPAPAETHRVNGHIPDLVGATQN